MRELEFERFLLNDQGIHSKYKAVKSRMSKARAVEKQLNEDMDSIVRDDKRMYQALKRINSEMKNFSGAYFNSLRKYYIFCNSTEFPKLDAYNKITV